MVFVVARGKGRKRSEGKGRQGTKSQSESGKSNGHCAPLGLTLNDLFAERARWSTTERAASLPVAGNKLLPQFSMLQCGVGEGGLLVDSHTMSSLIYIQTTAIPSNSHCN